MKIIGSFFDNVNFGNEFSELIIKFGVSYNCIILVEVVYKVEWYDEF